MPSLICYAEMVFSQKEIFWYKSLGRRHKIDMKLKNWRINED
jgi:hypothetical protein